MTMNFIWNSTTIKWYQDADAYSGFFKNIADLIVPRLEGYSTLCDIGCGLGLVDLEFSKNIESITCIDNDKEAIKALKKSIDDRKITNIEPHLMSSDSINETWDVIYISFFGSHNMERFLPFCKKLIAVVDKKKESKPYIEQYRSFHRNTVEKVEHNLNSKGIPYLLTEASFEFGQPLVSIEEAKNFIRNNYHEVNDEDLNRFLSQRLIETNEREYPFYIQKMKSVGIFEIEGDCI